MVPFPLHVEHSRGEGVTICMTKVEGRVSQPISSALDKPAAAAAVQPRGKPAHPRGADAFVSWLARLHAHLALAQRTCGHMLWKMSQTCQGLTGADELTKPAETWEELRL